jgi:hypothetical protein
MRFSRKIGLMSPVLLGMVWINWSIDPIMLYDGHFDDRSRHPYVQQITADLLAGKPHFTSAFYSERLVDEVMFREGPKIDLLVLGSSMAKPIHGEMFPGSAFYNAATYGGRLEEMIGIWEVARTCGVRPKRVLLQLDAGAVGRRPYPLSAEFSAIVQRARVRLVGESDSPDRDAPAVSLIDLRVPGEQVAAFANRQGLLHPYDTLISPRYLQLSLQYWMSKWSSPNDLPALFPAEDQHQLFPDGSVQWCSRWRLRKITDFHTPTENSQVPIVAADWMHPVDKQCRLFEAFLRDVEESGAQVEFVLLPTNPWLTDIAAKEYRQAGKPLPSAETEAYLRTLAERHRIPVIGSLDPHKTNVVEQDFVDMVHLRRESIAPVFKVKLGSGKGDH